MTGGRNLAGHHIGNAGPADCARQAGQQTGVHVIFIHPAKLHCLVGVDDGNNLGENTGLFLTLQITEQVLLVFGEAQIIAVLGSSQRAVIALRARTGEGHDRHIVVIALPTAFLCLNLVNRSFRNLLIGGKAHRHIHAGQCCIHVVCAQCGLQRVHQTHGGNGVKRGAVDGVACRVNRVVGAVAKNSDALSCGNRERGVLVFEQYSTFLGLRDVLCSNGQFHVHGSLSVRSIGAVGVVIIDRVCGFPIAELHDFARAQVQCLVDNTGVIEHQYRGRNRCEHRHGHDGSNAACYGCLFFHCLPPVSFPCAPLCAQRSIISSQPGADCTLLSL